MEKEKKRIERKCIKKAGRKRPKKSMFFSLSVDQKTGQLKKTCFLGHFEKMENQNLGQILLECFVEKSGFF